VKSTAGGFRQLDQDKQMIAPGNLLISHPHWADDEFIDSVLLITEHTPYSTVALQLNKPIFTTLQDLVLKQGFECNITDTAYKGGSFNPGALIMLHDNSWYSSNTMPINKKWSISSDHFMIDKLADGNTPRQFRCMLGVSGWEPGQLENELMGSKPRWMILKSPPESLIMAKYNEQYQLAINQVSKYLTAQYF